MAAGYVPDEGDIVCGAQGPGHSGGGRGHQGQDQVAVEARLIHDRRSRPKPGVARMSMPPRHGARMPSRLRCQCPDAKLSS